MTGVSNFRVAFPFVDWKAIQKQTYFLLLDILANFDAFKCPDYDLIHQNIDCAFVFKIIA